MIEPAATPARPRFSWSAKLLLLVVLLLNLFSLGLLAYRFTLPTDGWRVIEPDGFEATGLIYQENVLGAESGLQVGDWVTAVNDVPTDSSAIFTPPSLGNAWRTGNTLYYTLLRDGQTLSIEVPLMSGRVGQWLQATVFSDLVTIFAYGGTAFFVAISYYTFWKRPDNPAAVALLMMAAFLFNIMVLLDILPQSFADLFNPFVNNSVNIIILGTFSYLLPPAFIQFGLVFPHPKPILGKQPWLAYLPYLVGTAVLIAFLNKAFVWGWVWTGTAVLISLLLLLHNAFTMRDTTSRGQLRWALGGATVGMGLFLLNYVGLFLVESSVSPMGQLLSGLSQLSFPIMGISLAVAVLRYSLFGIDHLVNRALVYGGLTLAVVAIYVLVVGYLGYLFQTETNLTISLVATGLVAVLFDRLRGLLQRSINRLMYGRRDEPYQLLTQLGQQLETGQNTTATLPLFAETIATALKLPYTAVCLPQSSLPPLASYGLPQPKMQQFPLVAGGVAIGELVVGLRAPDEPLTPSDRRLLMDMARQLAPTVQALQLAADLEQARLRIVTERGEARRRLGSDLHDVVGHQLVGINRQLQHALHELGQNPVQARHHLAKIDSQLTALTNQVRQLAHQLYPPELELLGLVGALHEQAQTHPTLEIMLDAPERLPKLSAEVETAVYTISLEAITNIEKHAQAQTCTIHLRLNAASHPPLLELEIVDDGDGIAVGANAGLGVLSMQARAAEVGGVCKIMANERGGGTAVTVRIPCSIKPK